MVIYIAICIEKRFATKRIQQPLAVDIEDNHLLFVDGLYILWRLIAIGTDRSQPIFTIEEEPVQHIQAFHQRIGNVHHPTHFI